MPGAEDDKKMPLLDHLVELRRRLLYSALALFIAFIFCFYFAQHIFNFLAQPLANILLKETGRRFIYTDLTEVFFTQVKVAVFGAACITFPIIASQIWMFVAPGLYKNERQAFLPFLVATPVLFILGAALLYYRSRADAARRREEGWQLGRGLRRVAREAEESRDPVLRAHGPGRTRGAARSFLRGAGQGEGDLRR